MSSTLGTGGAGVHFESRVAAGFLGSVLCRTGVRGLPEGVCAVRAELQRAFEGDSSSLDDVIVYGTSASGKSRLTLQVKRDLTFGNNQLFKEVMADCWKTFCSPEFVRRSDRFGVAIGKIAQAVEKGGREVLALARGKADAADFLSHLEKPGVASEGMRDFASNIRDRLDECKATPVTDSEFWEFLAHFRIEYYDFEQSDSSELHSNIAALQAALIPSNAERAADLWNALVAIADEHKPAAGSLTRDRLVELLHHRFRLSGLRQNAEDVERITTSSDRVLNSIRVNLGTIHLDRDDTLTSLIRESNESQFVEITGEPGSGKSALLRAFAEIKANDSPVLVIDAKRLPETPGLESLERLWGITKNLDQLVPEFSRIERPCLFIDAIDRIDDAGRWATINDLIRCIRGSESGARWRIIVSARENALDYRQNLADEALGEKQGRVNVEALSKDEIAKVAAAYPALSELIQEDGPASNLAKRPYLLDRLIKSKTLGSDRGSPKITEIDLMLDFWTDDAGKGAPSRTIRQRVLTGLGRALLAGEPLPKAFDVAETDTLHTLAQDDILQINGFDGTISFSHDIIEDWILTQCLDDPAIDIPSKLQELKQALWLVEPIQTLAQYRLEKRPDTADWSKLLQSVSTGKLDPRWRRAVLTAPLQSPAAYELIRRLEETFFADSARLLRELLVALRTTEIIPNTRWYNPQIEMDGLDSSMRRELAYWQAAPRPRAWRPFLGWLQRRIFDIPPHLVSELSEVLEVLPRAFGSVPEFLTDVIVDWARYWLQPLDRHWRWNEDEALRARYHELKLDRHDEHKLADRLRHLILASAEGSPEKVAGYLREVGDSKRHEGAEYIIQNSNLLAPHMPHGLVDFMLRTMCFEEVEDEESHEGFGYWHHLYTQNELGIDNDRLYFPSAHVRPPFLMLLQHNEAEGLRLINSLCNRSIEVWRSLHSGGRDGTAVPVRISFPWGQREFWGHGREYLWFRGLGVGPYSVCSALMALEAWTDGEVEKGRELNDLFETVLKENNCVAALGVCVSLTLANVEKALDAALPFVTNPYLLDWDLQRCVQERPAPSNLIGFWPRDRIYYEQVRQRNALPRRQQMLRNVFPRYLLGTQGPTQSAFLKRIKEIVEGDLPYEFEEWRGDADIEASLKDKVRRIQAMADPANYQLYNSEDGKQFIFQYEHPSDLAPDAERVAAEQSELNEYLRVAMWVEKSLEAGSLQPDLSLQEALAKAREWDDPGLFSAPVSSEDMRKQYRAAAVAGAVALSIQYELELSDPELSWRRDLLMRAVATPFDDDGLTIRMSAMSFHPAIYAVRGMMALVLTRRATQEDKFLIFSLVCHPLEAIFQTIFTDLQKCWDTDPTFCWQVLVLSVKLSLRPSSITTGGMGLAIGEPERNFLEQILGEVITDYGQARSSDLPPVPLPWVEDPASKPHPTYGRYTRSDILFMWNLPSKSLFRQPLGTLLADKRRREQLIALLTDYMAWTEQDCSPPWDESARSGSNAYEWRHAFMAWCAELSLHLRVQETSALIIDRLLAIDGRHDDSLMADFIREFLTRHYSQDAVPDNRTVELWKRLFDITLTHKDARHLRDSDFLTRDYGESVGYMLFCNPARCLFEHPWQPVHLFDDEIERWAAAFGAAKACYGMLVSFLGNAGWVYAPGKAIDWLSRISESRKDNPSFWTYSDNGSGTVDLLEKIIDEFELHIQQDVELMRKIIRIADILTDNGLARATLIQQRMAKLSSRKAGTRRQ